MSYVNRDTCVTAMCALRKTNVLDRFGVIDASILSITKVSRTPMTETSNFPREEVMAGITNNDGKLAKTLHGFASDA